MGKYLHRPGFSTHYGDRIIEGAGNILGDANNNTYVQYYENCGSIQTYPVFNESVIPVGRDIIAVRVGHRHWQGGVFNLFNGWVASYLRINNSRNANSYAYKQDGFSGGTREILGPAIYRTAGAGGWSAAEINTMSTDTGAAVGEIGPNGNNRWCIVSEVYIVVIYNDLVSGPTSVYPANNEVVATSSVQFNAVQVPTQEEQPVCTVFQVARDAAFTTDVRTFVGGLNKSTVAGSKSFYNSVKGKPSYTDLGPGKWYMRTKGRDYTGTRESAWGATTSFTVSHAALPTPTLLSPANGTTVATPYNVRQGSIPTDPPGDRIVGIEFAFSKQADFTGTVVSWQNRDGLFTQGAIAYDPKPNGTALPGKNSGTVSSEDPSQYLSQGLWNARVRCVDRYGQVGPWSSVTTFTVAHKPYASNYFPKSGQAFDPNETPVAWDFSDPWDGDIQSAYQLVVTDLGGNTLQDTGKITSSLGRATMVLASSHLQEQLRYTIALWDLDDVKSTVMPTQNFFMSKSPVITIPFPEENEAIITGQPSITWSSVFSRPGVAQKSWKLDYVQRDNQTVKYTTGIVAGTATSHMPPRAILANMTSYQIKLTITDTDDLSSTKVRNFTTNFERPNPTTTEATASTYELSGFVKVTWTATPDPFFAEWRVYRQKVDEAGLALDDWEYAGRVEDVDAREFHDWLVGGSSWYRYSVTQVAYRFGSLVESDYDHYGERVRVFGSHYWLVVEDREELNVRLNSVNADKFTDKFESNDFQILGGGRRFNYGAEIGKEGSLSIQIRGSSLITATEQLRVLRVLRQEKIAVLMRDPFGNVTKVALGEVSVDRMPGVGNNEFANIEVPYYEVK